MAWKHRRRSHKNGEKAAFTQKKKDLGLLVTDELESALNSCKERVERIARDCRAKNRKFRDQEFDTEVDRERCLHGIGSEEKFNPSDVQRVTDIFPNPQFFIDGANSNDLVQGAIGNCWFVSALATMSTAEGLIERFCVARDEQVGVYGFIFFRDSSWETVIIDDLLFTSIPKFEELSTAERQLYHNDKDLYNASARKNGKSLYFARSGTQGETWVPLLEKAYAKLHGNYGTLCGGQVAEAIEDLTGGVSTYIPSKDILDIDKFWKEELLKANADRLFGCSYRSLDSTRSGQAEIKINGLIGSHAYSVLRAVEVRGKRFVIVRNPWGRGEWTGPWSDGSREWTPEWLAALSEIGHTFGDDGQFIMEYKDFLECWDSIDRTLLFDPSWVMSCQWVQVKTRPLFTAWSYGDVSFTFSLPESSLAIIVLSQLDERFFERINGRCAWRFDFVLFKEGEEEAVGESSHARFTSRSVNLEIDLAAGNYVVHVRLDRLIIRDSDYLQELMSECSPRNMTRVLTEKAKSCSAAVNFNWKEEGMHLPIPLSFLAGRSISAIKQGFEEAAIQGTEEEEGEEVVDGGNAGSEGDGDEDEAENEGEEEIEGRGAVNPVTEEDKMADPSELNTVFLGLKVYTKKNAPVSIAAQLMAA
ncbi:hypothetical protein E1B28_010352 [Marasmius oreades]|uniref:Calpain catalytic domain-containing protein n=1 Tax=Marasmius oreades TaxID=181124 RepID=A0A9P7USL5_9AGAR|nr:uncharacterized protein E1B28_010352 [Marasmius oreades]KAG7091306.1 hypothetical protein E1B28_010352 [Marasmius oreades]